MSLDARAALARHAADIDAVADATWWVIGSAALALSGVPGVEPDDIDVLCSPATACALAMRWAAHRLADDATLPGRRRFRSEYHRFALPCGRIEAMGGLDVRVGDVWRPVRIEADVVIDLDGATVRVPALGEQARLLRLFGRDKDFARLRLLDAARPTAAI